ncbi:YitT family protein [Planococcus sp. N028]|uniref:YitT family protein n=1 Tax=Planococcus shixiaomingii TaxID=3058393 RepID=A0ABT8N0U2_9BACL|nr:MULTISPECIES: YitT family protein [unclassified Planococcus (in: firmicutes)]MDN7241513.1 YitT family protein [Planococcus sp. N028]WKA53765.1 YitT family protein [Planococcus sp. N022]
MTKKQQRVYKEPHPILTGIRDYLSVLIGSAIVAIAFNVLLLPNEVASGGVSGISTILKGLFDWKPAFVQWTFNIPLFIAGLILLGRHFGVKTALGTIFLPFVVFLTEAWEPWTMNPLLGSLFGGILVGAGIGIVFRAQASTGGTDLAAQIITKFTGLTLGTSVALIDGFIVLAAAVVFDIEKGLYALIGLYVTTKTIDLVQVGFGRSKLVYIITNKQVEIRDAIYEEIDRGVTKITATGGYTETEKPLLMVVVHQTEFTRLKQLVKLVDPSAFVIVSDAAEVLGEGFKRS